MPLKKKKAERGGKNRHKEKKKKWKKKEEEWFKHWIGLWTRLSDGSMKTSCRAHEIVSLHRI
jgi:hypothetical protein